MSEINEEKTKQLEHICGDAKVVDARRCQPILCASANSDAGIAPQVSYPILRQGDVCVATTFFKDGHLSPTCSVETSKMYGCQYRKTN